MSRNRKIGLISIIAITILIALVLYFYYFWNTYAIHAEFDNASGLSRFDDVSFAGMRIGSVWDLSLTENRKVHAVMLLYNRYRDYIPIDSTAKIISGQSALGGSYSIDITPGASRVMIPQQGYVHTEKTVELEDLMAKAEVLTDTMQSSFSAVDELLSDPKITTALRNSALHMEIASRRSVNLLACLQSIISENRAHIPEILQSVDTTASNFEVMSRDLRRLTSDSIPVVKQITSDTSKAAQDFKVVSQGLRRVINSTSSADIARTLRNAKTASEDIEVVSERIRLLTEDPALAAQAKTMLNDLQKALSGAAEVVDRIKMLLDAEKAKAPQTDSP